MMVFGAVESVVFYLIVSMGFVYPLLSVVFLAAIAVVQSLEHCKGWRWLMGLPLLVVIAIVFQLGPLLCFFSPSLERLYDLPFSVMRRIFS